MKRLFIYKGLELEANINGYATYELKDTEFIPEYIGKLNFYCSAVDDILCREGDNRTIGLLLCKSKDRIKAEYALRDLQKPIGISDYELGQVLPKDFHGSLPTIEEIEKELASDSQWNELINLLHTSRLNSSTPNYEIGHGIPQTSRMLFLFNWLNL